MNYTDLSKRRSSDDVWPLKRADGTCWNGRCPSGRAGGLRPEPQASQPKALIPIAGAR